MQTQVHDFFTPQPDREVSFFFLKQILHDWSDEYCSKILIHLRKAASPSTKLLSMDSVIPYACRDTSPYSFPGAIPDEAPSPFLANWGGANTLGYQIDITASIHMHATHVSYTYDLVCF